MRRRHAVDARHHLHALLHHGEIGGVGAEIAEIGAAHREKLALVIERELGFDDEIARLIVAQERFAALDDPFHRPAELFRRPGDQRKFRIDHAAGAEIAADVAHQDADLLRRHAEHGGEIVFQADGAAVAGINRKATGRGVECGERAARLHRHAGDALHPGLEPRHMRGARKRRIRRRGIAQLGIETHIRACRSCTIGASCRAAAAVSTTAGSTS